MSSIDFYKYPAQIKLSEEYACNLTLPFFNTVTKTWGEDVEPEGKLEVNIPYDVWQKLQKEYENKQTGVKNKITSYIKAVQKELGIPVDQDDEWRQPQIANYERTNLDAILDIYKLKDSLPIEKLVVQAFEENESSCDDTRERKLKITYQPDNPGPVPIDIRLSFYDEYDASQDPPPFDPWDGLNPDKKVSWKIQKNALLKNLIIKIDISLKLESLQGLQPEIKKFSLKWPPLLQLPFIKYRCVSSKKDGKQEQNCGDGVGVVVCSNYYPDKQEIIWRKLSWLGKSCSKSQEKFEQEYRWELYIKTQYYPFELFRLLEDGKIEIEGQLEFNIPDFLYSGSSVSKQQKFLPELKQSSKIACKLKLNATDCLQYKIYYPYQYFYFENLLFDELRKADVITSLKDGNFEADEYSPRRFSAYSAKNLRPLYLLLGVETKDYKTRRKKKIPGDEAYTTSFDSGYTKIFIQGHVRKDFHAVVKAMTTLHCELKERFKHVNSVE